jgi:hypothetical protein
MLIRNQIVQELDELDETELKQVAEYIAFLRLRAQHRIISSFDEAELASMYAEFAGKDR